MDTVAPVAPSPPRPLHRLVPLAGFAALLLGTFALAAYVEGAILDTFGERVARLRIASLVRARLFEAHLWLEEGLGGDAGVDFDAHVQTPFRDATAILDSALEGGTLPPPLSVDLRPIEDAEIRTALIGLRERVSSAEQIARSRWTTRKADGFGEGSAVDAECDARFEVAVNEASRVSDLLRAHMDRTGAALYWWFRAGTAVAAALILAVAWLVWRGRRDLETRQEALESAVAARTEELRRSESRMRALFDAAVDGIVLVDSDGKIESSNPALLWIFDRRGEELAGTPLGDLFVAEDRPALARALAAGRRVESSSDAGERSRSFEIRGARRGGSIVPVEVSLGALPGGDRPRFIAVIRDATARKRAEEERDRFFTLSLDLLCVTDLEGRFLRTSPSFVQTLGWAPEELRGVSYRDILHPDDGDATRNELRRLAAGHPTVRFRNRLRTKSGEWRWLQWTAVPVVADDVIYAAARDVTEEQALQLGLEEAREAALEATRAKSEFLANMSHEIRTPLNAVIGMTDLLTDSPLTPEQREYADIVRSSGDALLLLINDILDFSKIEARHVELEAVPFSVDACVEEALEMAAPRAAPKHLDLLYERDPLAPAALVGDPSRVRQVVLNLVGNAVKFTERGEVHVKVHAERLDDGRYRVRFAVRDTGIGIPAEDLGRLFRSFSQVDASTTRRFGGTGLGLAISKGLVDLMGGEMGVTSEPGKGSEFRFTITAAAADLPPAPTEIDPAILRNRSILVVDDNECNRRIVAGALAEWGARSLLATTPSEARDLLGGGAACDAVVLDLHLPGESGIDLGVGLRGLPGRGSLPLLLLSSLDARGEGQRARKHGFSEVLVKPARRAALRDALARMLGGKQAPAESTKDGDGADGELASRLPLRILVAEDNPVNQRVAQRLLERLGYRPRLVDDGLQAVEALRREEFDLVFLDMQMPVMDGLEAARCIRTEHAGPRPFLAALTANATEEDRRACAAAGMNDYLSKPVRAESLRRVVERASAALSSGAPAAAAAPAAEPHAPIVAAASGEVVLDMSIVDGLKALSEPGGADLFAEVVDLFLGDAPRKVEALVAAAVTMSADGAGIAHSMKGSAGNVGARELSRAAARLETAFEDGDAATARDVVAALPSTFARARDALIAAKGPPAG